MARYLAPRALSVHSYNSDGWGYCLPFNRQLHSSDTAKVYKMTKLTSPAIESSSDLSRPGQKNQHSPHENEGMNFTSQATPAM